MWILVDMATHFKDDPQCMYHITTTITTLKQSKIAGIVDVKLPSSEELENKSKLRPVTKVYTSVDALKVLKALTLEENRKTAALR